MLASIYLFGSHLLTGLLVRQVIDALQGVGVPDWSVWTFLLLLLLVEASRTTNLAWSIGIYMDELFLIEALVRRNSFGWLLNAPGTRLLGESSGGALTHLRDDAHEVTHWIEALFDVAGVLTYAVVSVIIMFTINWQITLADDRAAAGHR